MKKILNTVLLASLLVACYEDKGNYDYSLDNMNKITDVTFSPSVVESTDGKLIELRATLTESDVIRRIEANVNQSHNKDYDNLHFYWYLTHADVNGKLITDTVETNGYLEIEQPIGKEVDYDVYLKVYDRETTLSHYVGFKIKTRPIYKNSLFVLHGEGNNRKLGNIEIIGSDTYIYTDACAMLFPGENLFTKAEGLTYTTYYDIDNGAETYNLTVFNSDGTAAVYNPYGLKLKYPQSAFFKPQSESFVFDKNIQTGDPSNDRQYRMVLSRDGKFYVGNHVAALYKPGAALDSEDNNALHQTDYMVTAATITENRFVMWDAKNNRFLYMGKEDSDGYARTEVEMNDPARVLSNPVLDANVDFSKLEKSPVGMQAVYAYIQYRENYPGANPYFIFKDANSNEYYRYELTPLALAGEKQNMPATRSDVVEPAFEISCEKMSGFRHDGNPKTLVYNSWFTTNFLFYAVDGTVYRYNISNGDHVIVYTAPEGYDVSILKFRTEDSNSYSSDLGRYLCIGLNKGENGAVAEVYLNTAADVDKDVPIAFYEKDANGIPFENIYDLQFTQIYAYKVPTYW